MKNQTVKNLIAIALIAAVGAVTTLTAGAADPKPTPARKKENQAAKSPSLPFHGKLDSVDKTAKSVKVGDRIFQVMAATKITKDGAKPGTLDDAKVGEAVAGAYHEGDDGKFQLVSLRLGPKPEKKAVADKKK
jgi:hypothetical protein